MILPNYTFLHKLFKRFVSTRGSITDYHATTVEQDLLLNQVNALLVGAYDKIELVQLEHVDKAWNTKLKWIYLEALIYQGELDLAKTVFNELENVEKLGEYDVIKALYDTYVNLNFANARKTLQTAEKKLKSEHLFAEEYAYRMKQVHMMKEVITWGG